MMFWRERVSNMKALSTSLIVVVTAIVILVVALVVITIFTGGTQQISTLTEARSYCATIASSSCAVSGKMPPNWSSITVMITNINNERVKTTCQDLMTPDICSNYKYEYNPSQQ